jgi:hypothetical protein
MNITIYCWSIKECLHQGKNAFVPDASPHPAHKGRMRDFVEAGFDVPFYDPLIRAGGEVVHLGHRVMRRRFGRNP